MRAVRLAKKTEYTPNPKYPENTTMRGILTNAPYIIIFLCRITYFLLPVPLNKYAYVDSMF